MKLWDIYRSDYTVKFSGAMRQRWFEGEVWSCMSSPKKMHMFLYLDGCSAIYRMKDGREIRANSGDFMYVSAGCEYQALFYNCENERAGTLGVNFELFDERGEYVTDPFEIGVFSYDGLRVLMVEIERLSYSLCDVPMKYNALLYGIFNLIGDGISSEEYRQGGFELIRAGAEYLNKHFNEDISTEELAGMCCVSSVYFRRLFKLHTGMTPNEYRTHMRLVHAEELLKYGEAPISEISERLGFTDSSYFVKIFKEKYGQTPLSYRKRRKF